MEVALLCLTLWSHELYSPWNSSGQNTGMGSLFPSPGDLPNPGIEHGLPHCRQILYQLSHKESPRIMDWVAYPFFSRSSQHRNLTGVSCIAGGFLISWAQGKLKNTRVGSLSLLQQIFPTQESNWGLLHCRLILYQLSYQLSCISNNLYSKIFSTENL